MLALDLMADLAGRGATVSVDDEGKLCVTPSKLLTAQDRVNLRELKPELLRLLLVEPDDHVDRANVEAGGEQPPLFASVDSRSGSHDAGQERCYHCSQPLKGSVCDFCTLTQPREDHDQPRAQPAEAAAFDVVHFIAEAKILFRSALELDTREPNVVIAYDAAEIVGDLGQMLRRDITAASPSQRREISGLLTAIDYVARQIIFRCAKKSVEEEDD